MPAETCTKAPVLKQYWFWLSHFVQGKMGQSFVTNRAVSTDLKSSFGNTFQLLIFGVLISALLAVSDRGVQRRPAVHAARLRVHRAVVRRPVHAAVLVRTDRHRHLLATG